MEVSFTDFNPNTPTKDRYEYVSDYISTTFDLDIEDTFYLIKQLKNHRSSVVIYAAAIVDFQFYDGSLCVQIDGDGFWFADSISLENVKEILKITFEDCTYFGQYLPKTDTEWGAWTPR